MMAREYEIEDLAKYRRDIDAVTQRACSSFRRDAMAVASRYGDPASWTRGDKAEIRDAVASLMSAHVDAHSAATQALASGFVEDILEAQGGGAAVEVVERDVAYPASQSARYWYRRIDEGDIDGFVAGCESFVERSVSHAGDMSLLDGAFGRKGKARLRYARVPSGPTCPFCLMLASRGFAYVTPESAGELGKFHDRCDCRIVAGYEGLKVKGYDPEGMRVRIKACRDAIGSPSDVWDDFAALPQAEKARYGRGGRAYDARLPEELVERIGEHSNAFNDYYFQRIMAEVATRDREWLYDGTVHEPTYATAAIKKSVTETNPWEERSAKRLATVGIKPDFIRDYEWFVDTDGIKKRRGLPDFANGVEMKTPKASKNPYGAVDNYLESCIGKKGLTRIVIDNYESGFSDEELRAAIVEVMRDYPFDMVSYYGKDNCLRNVYKKR